MEDYRHFVRAWDEHGTILLRHVLLVRYQILTQYVAEYIRPILPHLPIHLVIQQTRSSVLAPIRDIPGRCAMSDRQSLVRRVRAMDRCSSGDAMSHSRVVVPFSSPVDHYLHLQRMLLRTSSFLEGCHTIGSILRMIIDGDEEPLRRYMVPTRQHLQPTRHSCSDRAL